MISKILKVPANVGLKSLIVANKQRPCPWGNYFWIDEGKNSEDDGWRVLNMWAENLNYARENFLKEDGLVQIRTYEYENKKFCIIDDELIPEDYYYNKLCFTGYFKPTTEVAKEIFDYLGDPNNEFEQFTDPVNYWNTRGWTYDPKTGIRTKKFFHERNKKNDV